MGSQQAVLFPRPKHDGVFGLWYGKGPGVDRSGDAFKHANLAGTARYGGVLVAFGDDHGAKSSTTAHQSEQAMVAAAMPVLYPAGVAELLQYGLYGWAMSRFTGLWVGLKCVNETAEATASVPGQPLEREIVIPATPVDAESVHVHMRFEPAACEQRLVDLKLPRVAEFTRSNGLNRVVFEARTRRLGIVTAGKSYVDVRHALKRLGLDAERARDLGVGLLKIGVTWPLEPTIVQAFARGFEKLLVIEEKRAFLEDQVMRSLYHLASEGRPRVVGKTDEEGHPLLRAHGTLEVHDVARAIVARLRRLGLADAQLEERLRAISPASLPAFATAAAVVRTPYFCSGCPHNTSTAVPSGSQAMAGIGCSTMALWMNRDTFGVTQMGGEGANWLGIAPFTDTPHVFQNVGDGTYVHSGLLAIRAAVAAGVNITYKLLFNGAVAMTGGQPLEGALTVPALVAQLRAEGVGRVDVVTDEPEKYQRSGSLPTDILVHHRRELDVVQGRLRATPGTTVLIYDQGCASQKRRARVRGRVPPSPTRVYINSAVCEGCGDCSATSNCVSVIPLETELGHKRAIDQSSCNQDISCLQGFCPAFVTVRGGTVQAGAAGGHRPPSADALPTPRREPGPCALIVTGIGGTGVVTVSAVLAMAAHLQGETCSVYDMTGLAQKNGAVISHVRIRAPRNAEVPSRIGAAEATALLACDLLVTQLTEVLQTLSPCTRIVANTHVMPTGSFQLTGALPPAAADLIAALRAAVGVNSVDAVDATGAATATLGDSVFTNLLMIGFLWQRGALPLDEDAILRAIELNGAAVDANKRAFALGRQLAATVAVGEAPSAAEDLVRSEASRLEDMVKGRVKLLTDYQSAGYAEAYARFVATIESLEQQKVGAARAFSITVAASLAKLMTYKDEYEVARLHTNSAFAEALRKQFSGELRLVHHFAPPSLGDRKRAFGPWIRPALRGLARLKWLRGTRFDPFGRNTERRLERALIADYRHLVERLARDLTPANYALATQIANLPLAIRGFGPVKLRNIDTFRRERDGLLQQFWPDNRSSSRSEESV